MAKLLVDDNGEVKDFEQWRKEAEPIGKHHNQVWLRTEYDTAIKRANQALQWQQFEDEADVLPNLRWVPTTAVTPGADHQIFWDTILPIDHPFWSAHKPGDRWGCQCSLEATDEPATAVPQSFNKNDQPSKGLDGNPGKTGELFSKSHPYFPSSCSSCPFAGEASSAMKNKAGDCKSCSAMRQVVDPGYKLIEKARKEYNSLGKEWRKDLFNEANGGYLATHQYRIKKSGINNAEKRKFDKEHSMAVNLANAGYKVKFLKDGDKPLGDCDITLNDILADLKKVESYKNVRRYISDTFGKKGGKIAVFEFESHDAHFLSELKEATIKSGQKILYYYSDAPEVICIYEKK